MDYKLFTDFITLQALLKETGIIPTGGAIKAFLAEQTVLVNGDDEKRRGKKLRLGDRVELPAQGQVLTLIAPSAVEIAEHNLELAEKKRVAELVKKMNQATKRQKPAKNKPTRPPKSRSATGKQGSAHGTQTYRKTDSGVKPPVRFPGVD